jgi:hypothetical protein
MASQPIFAPYTPLRHAAPKPNIRIAYIAGDASIAMHRGMAPVPAAKRESTLEELAIAGLTDELIAAAAELLSPAMYAAFLRWGETASHACTGFEDDEEGARRCRLTFEALATITALAPANMHDLLFKVHLVAIEAADGAAFSALAAADHSMSDPASGLLEGLARDLPAQSPMIAMLEELTTLAWNASGDDALALTSTIGAIITGAFSRARGELSLDIPAPRRLPAVLDGYSPYMRGPLVAWRRAYAVYEAAAAELAAYKRNTYGPTADRFTAARGDFRTPATPEIQALLDTIPLDEVQDRFDELVMAEHEAAERLWTLPAPGASELATKLQIFHDAQGWDLNCAGAALDRITADARRFGRHGAFLETDDSLLAAYAGCRTEMEFGKTNSEITAAEEDAYWERLGAHEEVLTETRATTIEGVIAKLRVAFSRNDAYAWSDHAVLDPNVAEFRDGLRLSGMTERMAWSAVEDLARIGGINLAEQGA